MFQTTGTTWQVSFSSSGTVCLNFQIALKINKAFLKCPEIIALLRNNNKGKYDFWTFELVTKFQLLSLILSKRDEKNEEQIFMMIMTICIKIICDI